MIEQVTVYYKDGTMSEDFSSLEEAGINPEHITTVCALTSNHREFGIEFEVHHHYKIQACEIWFRSELK